MCTREDFVRDQERQLSPCKKHGVEPLLALQSLDGADDHCARRRTEVASDELTEVDVIYGALLVVIRRHNADVSVGKF